MAEYYKIVSSEKELENFYKKVIDNGLGSGESYMFALSCRHKKLTDEQKKTLGVGRSEMMRTYILRSHKHGLKFDNFKEAVYSYECRKEGLLTSKGFPYPENGLVLYMYLNPCSEVDCVDDTVTYALNLKTELVNSCIKHSSTGIEETLYKLSKVFEHIKSCHAQHPARKRFIDFDLDLESSEVTQEMYDFLHEKTVSFFGERSFLFVKTSGGIHIVVSTEKLKFNPNDYISAIVENWSFDNKIKELIMNKNCMIPLPGTYQYGNPVTVLNWADYEGEPSNV